VVNFGEFLGAIVPVDFERMSQLSRVLQQKVLVIKKVDVEFQITMAVVILSLVNQRSIVI
jgi:hypothetical protein